MWPVDVSLHERRDAWWPNGSSPGRTIGENLEKRLSFVEWTASDPTPREVHPVVHPPPQVGAPRQPKTAVNRGAARLTKAADQPQSTDPADAQRLRRAAPPWRTAD